MLSVNLQPNENGDVTLEEKARRTAIQFCVQTVMTSNDAFKHLKSTDIYSSIRGALFSNGMVDSDMGVQKVHSMDGRKPFLNVCNILSADEIASSVKTFSGQREVHVSDSTGHYIVYGSVTCFTCVSHATKHTSIKSKR